MQSQKLIKLPKSGERQANGATYIKLIRRITPRQWNFEIEGILLCPGALVKAETLGANPVLLESAGHIGPGRIRHKRPTLYILWQYDWPRERWIELGRAESLDWTWRNALHGQVLDALRRGRPMLDVIEAGGEIADEVVGVLDARLKWELLPVCMTALTMVSDEVASRLVAIEDEVEGKRGWEAGTA